MEWYEILISILSGLAVTIPLVIELACYIEKLIKEKNWSKLVALVVKLMQEAEIKFADGAEKREWVICMVKASADAINYPIDVEVIGGLIDDLCAMSKIVNPPAGNDNIEE